MPTRQTGARVTEGILIYGTGSPLLVDIEESLFRVGIPILAGLRNRAGECFLSDRARAITPDELTAELKHSPFVVPLFTPGNRQEAVEEARSLGFTTPFSLVDPTVALPRAISHDAGFYVNAGCSLGAGSWFGEFVCINRGAGVGHHVRCEAFVSIGPGAVIAGQVRIGKGAFIGAGAVILPKLAVGENAVIAAGAVVTRDVPDFCLVAGNPARIVKRGISGHNGKSVV